jgi:hypothetical protein
MSNEHTLSQYQKRVDNDSSEEAFIEKYCLKEGGQIENDIREMLETKGYHKDILWFFHDIASHAGLDAILTDHAQDAYRQSDEDGE